MKVKYNLIWIIIFILILLLYGNTMTCDKTKNTCVVKSLYTGQILDSFNYDKIHNVSCQYTGRRHSLIFTEPTELLNNYYKFGNKHETLYFQTDFICNKSVNKFYRYKNSNKQILKMRGYTDFFIGLFLFIFVLMIIDQIRANILYYSYNKKRRN